MNYHDDSFSKTLKFLIDVCNGDGTEEEIKVACKALQDIADANTKLELEIEGVIKDMEKLAKSKDSQTKYEAKVAALDNAIEALEKLKKKRV